MLDDEVKELRKDLREILVAIARLDEQVKSLASISTQVQDTTLKVALIDRDVVTLTLQVKQLEDISAAELKSRKEDRKWLIGVAFGAIAIALTVIQLLQKGGIF